MIKYSMVILNWRCTIYGPGNCEVFQSLVRWHFGKLTHELNSAF